MPSKKMKPKATGVWLYVPATFDPSLFPALKGHENEANWFVHKVISLGNYYRHSRSRHVHISRQTMEQFIHPSAVSVVKNALLDAGVIECDGKYVKAQFSMGYRLADAYVADMKRTEVTKRAMAAKIKRHRIKYNDKPIEAEKLALVHGHLRHWLRKLHIDTEQAYTIVEALPEKAHRKKRKLGRRGRRRVINGYVKHMNRMTIDELSRMSREEYDFTVCRYGRVHTPVTRLFSEVRSCLSVEGRALVNIDIRNSQLIFFSLLLLEDQFERVIRSEDVVHRSEAYQINQKILLSPKGQADAQTDPNVTNYPRTTFLKEKGVGSGLTQTQTKAQMKEMTTPEDETKFIERVMEGTVYDHLMAQVNDPTMTRKQFKQGLFQDVLYGDPHAHYTKLSKLAKLFRREYPSVWAFIVKTKTGTDKDAWKHLARRMQERESRFMIGTVVERLRAHHAGVPVITIHDSILTTPEHVDTVKRVINEEFLRLGVDPKVKVDA